MEKYEVPEMEIVEFDSDITAVMVSGGCGGQTCPTEVGEIPIQGS